jgi:hypothetical protein
MVTIVGCAISYILLFLCPIIYLNYFWRIKYQHIIIYMKMGKRNGEKKKKREFLLAGPRGDFGPPGRERGRRPTRPIREGDGGGRCCGASPHVSEGREVNGAKQQRRGGERSTGARPPVKSRGGSPPWVWFYGGGAMARHGRG